MENFELPNQENRYEATLREKKFLKISYPLSREGEELKKKIQEGVAKEGDIPSVENPRPELFADFEIEESKLREVFGEDLANIQVTKGCRHQCTFCAAGAAREVETMSFPAVIKCGEQKRKFDQELEKQANQYFIDLERETGYTIDELRKIKGNESSFSLDKINEIAKRAANLFSKHPFQELYGKWKPNVVQDFWDMHKQYGGHTYRSFTGCVPVDYTDRFYGPIFHSVANYYDSDAFDYRDNQFLHKDGTPANFGDVAEQLASKARPLHVTTAGWSKTDPIAQQAAEKLVKMGKEFFYNLRLSFNPYEVRARKNIATYVEDTKNTIKTLAPLGLKVILFPEKNNQEWTEAIEQIKSYVGDTSGVHIEESEISRFSGRAAAKEHKDDHRDVMACMAGYHIWPDGTVAKQEYSESLGGVPKGTRPRPSGKSLWSRKIQ